MKILHWSEGYLPHAFGGIETMLRHLLEWQAVHGHEVRLVTNAPAGAEPVLEPAPFLVHRIPFTAALQSRNPACIAQTLDQVRAIKEAFQPDIIHTHTHSPGVYFHLRTRRASPCPEVATVHTLDQLGPKLGPLQRELYAGAGRIVCVSQFVENAFRAKLPGPEGRTCVVYNGVPLPDFPQAGAAAGNAAKGNRLFAGCRLVPEKGVEHAVAALPAILRQRPDTTLVLAGEGPCKAVLEAQARALGVAHAVVFAGLLAPEQMQAELRQASIVLVPSTWEEPFGLAAVEGAAAKRPLVLSRTGGLAELFADRVEALYVRPGCAQSLAVAVLELFEKPELAETLAGAARNKVELTYSLASVATTYENLYAAVL